VTDVVAYETIEAPKGSRPLLAAALDEGPVDALVLTSGSTARGLLALAATDEVRALLLATPVIAAGGTTAAAARDAGYATVLAAPSPSSSALAAFVGSALGATPGTTPTGDPR
jgi:uroporphyrinogen-III synthase